MDKNNYRGFSFLSKLYIKFKEKKLNSVDAKIKELQQQIQDEKKLHEYKEQYIEKLTEVNNSLKNKYAALAALFKNENKTFTIKNNNYSISVWENVFIKKKSNGYVLQTKGEQEIYIFNEDMNDSLEYLLSLNHSVIVLSVDVYRIVLQIRLL